MASPPPYSRLRGADLLPLATVGLRTRRVRSALSVLGIAIGIAAIVAVLGITRSSQSDLLARIDRLGTNLLTVATGQTPTGQPAELPPTAAATIARTPGVQHVAATAMLTGVQIYRTDQIPAYRNSGLGVLACDANLLSTLDARLASGVFFNDATARYPTAVLGHDAAQQLGMPRPGTRIWLGHHWFLVVGVLQPVDLAPDLASEINQAALIGFPIAGQLFRYQGHPTRVYVRTDTDQTAAVAALLAPATNPVHPETVAVSRPSDALTARLAVASATTTLLLGLGGVALLVGGIGIGNVMVISVLERRGEVGLRRALGAARRHVAAQFLIESLVLAGVGGTAGILFGVATTYGLARLHHWQPLVPSTAVAAALAAALVIGAIAGLYPATRAARLSPTEALRVA
ncbi:MAG TPA: ABC transporter permease [Rugosimonospora sp.]|nr:ABC transporter permease [Rugosimonospora sp.]